jgi:hypothetical protein
MRRLMQLCCIFLLLFAQHTALTHALWHAQAQLSAGEVACATAQVTHDTGAPDAAALCAFDAVLGQMLGGVLAGSHAPLPPSAATAAPHRLARSSPTPQFLAPLSRGPPSPLAS